MSNSRYKIIEGSPAQVAVVCETACTDGWNLNGALHMFTAGERVIAFQGLVRDLVVQQPKVSESPAVPDWVNPR